MLSGRRFCFRPILTLAAAAAFAALIGLGSWQLQRRAWKLDLIENVAARVATAPIPFDEAVRRAQAGENMAYAPVRLTGAFAHGPEAKVFGSNEGVAGVFLFAPVQTARGDVIYVNRGFVPQTAAARGAFSSLSPGPGATEVAGLFRYAERLSPPASWFRPRTKSADGFWFVRDPTLFAATAKITTPPFYIDGFAVAGVQWPEGGTTRLDFDNRHLEYALTWFGLAAALLGVWLVFSLPKP